MVVNCNRIFKKKLREIKKSLKRCAPCPQLDIIYIKKNTASEIYIAKKTKVAQELGIKINTHTFKRNINPDNIIATCNSLNQDPNCTGYFIQLPIREEFHKAKVLDRISAIKDVDGLSSENLGKSIKGDPLAIRPATVEAVIAVLRNLKIQSKSKKVTIINDSNLIGKPLAGYLLSRGATITICNEFTKDLKAHTKHADIVVTAVGKAGLIRADMISNNSVIIDVGITKVKGKITGDVDTKSVAKKAKAVTPVPNGIGPLTVICLFENLLKLRKLQQNNLK
ncbi:MAG: bifunctional 5,10-methylenetetrahydrofolate dehydrogenase/5,10-methenyltetrahydrofolate cyclohydrolase [Candidatus Dojkabacteria bacterium]|nr:bifunctional 5,10-methylenetetrahydrofolate dehydrogenase/5,10-methenyltetrahydrofolate cyclohydrolase [Candidatus Dojkabacteria bacterium]